MKHHFFHILLTSLLAISWNTESREPARYLYESNSLNSGTGNEEQNGEYQDGTYCAEGEYYCSKTGTNSTYTLNVDIENGELVKIYWPNGGWLHESNFVAPDISDDVAHFTSDRDVDYTVRIIGEEGDCSTSAYADDEDDLIQEQEDREEEYRTRREEAEEEFRQRREEAEEEYRQRQEEQEEERRQQEQEEENNQNEEDPNSSINVHAPGLPMKQIWV